MALFSERFLLHCRRCIAVCAALLAAEPVPCRSQAPVTGAVGQSLVFTAGTTARDAQGRDWAYLLWQAASPDLLRGRQFAVYRKAGPADAPSLYEPLGVATGVLSEPIIAAQLQRAVQVGGTTKALDDALTGLAAALNVTLSGGRPRKVVDVLSSAQGNTGLLTSIHGLAVTVPALALSLGVAFAAPMPPGFSTYEIREWDPVRCADIAVTGRITLQAGVVTPLPAPGTPVQVPDNSNGGDRSISIRWAVPDALRRRALLFHGFSLWRLPWSEAVARGYHITAPGAAALEALTGAGTAKRMSELPLFPAKIMSEAQAADFVTDPETFFLVDNNGRFEDPPGAPFPDGAEFAYIAAARDILGRPGNCSPAGRGQACRTAPPKCPADFAVRVIYDDPADPGHQFVRLTWTPDTDPEAAPATRFEIFRGTDQADISSDGGAPAPATLIASVNRTPHGGPMTFDDVSFNQNGRNEAEFYGRTQWYVMRAIHDGVRGPLATAPCAPLFATLSDHAAPQLPAGGEIVVSCPQPVVIHNAAAGFPATDDPPPADGEYHFRLVCRRNGPGVEWAEFTVHPSGENVRPLGRFFFGGESDTVELDLSLTGEGLKFGFVGGLPPVWTCRVGNGEAHTGNTASISYRPAQGSNAVRSTIHFLCGAVSPGAVILTDPLSAPLLGASSPLPSAAAPERDGWVTAGGLLPQVEYVIGLADGSRTVDWAVAEAGGTIRFFDPLLGEQTPAERGFSYRAWRFVRYSPCPADPPHQAVSADGRLLPLRLCIPKAPGSLEYRFFRRVNNGPLALFAQGRVTPGTGTICRSDDSLAAAGGCISYFSQFVGANGATSAMGFLGCRAICVEPPQPVLALPLPAGTAADPRLSLHWSCPPEGVDRFEVFLIPGSGEPLPAGVFTLASLALRSVALGPAVPGPAAPASLMKFNTAIGAAAYMKVREKLLTPRLGADGMGTGPAFSIELPVSRLSEYRVSIRAIGASGCAGKSSLQYTFKWQTPLGLPDRSVPWPARPLPDTVSDPAGAIRAELLGDTVTPLRQNLLLYPHGSHRAVAGVRIASLPKLGNEWEVANDVDYVHAPWEFIFRPASGASPDFHRHLLPRPRSSANCLPAALYRRQVPNELWPAVSGDTVQVSPLVTRISSFIAANPERSYLTDPFIAVQDGYQLGPDEQILSSWLDLFLLDTTPAVRGARYRYWLVCFTDAGEPDIVINAGEVTLPES